MRMRGASAPRFWPLTPVFGELVEFLLEKGADPNLAAAGFTALHEAIMRRDEKMVSALLAHGANPNAPLRTWTPTRRSSHDFHFDPALGGRDAVLAGRPFQPARRHAPSGEARRRSAVRAPFRLHRRRGVSTPDRSDHGADGGDREWAAGRRGFSPLEGEREALTLEAVKLAVELGVDVNAANTDGRTALDAAKTLKYESVGKFLVERGAKPGRQLAGL